MSELSVSKIESIQLVIEALIFSAQNSINLIEIQNCVNSHFKEEFSTVYIQNFINQSIEKYRTDSAFPFEICTVAEGYQFFTKIEYYPVVALTYTNKLRKRLSKASLETLSIIAYRQPVTKSEIQKIRGVNCDYAIKNLIQKGLIQIVKSSKKLQLSFSYQTTSAFLEFLGIATLEDLPRLPKK